MKRIWIVLLAVMVLLFSASPAENSSVSSESDSTLLYYHPEGGQYYHADQNCRLVNEKYLPLSGILTFAELNNEEYKDLQPCSVCGAPARRENQLSAPDSPGTENHAGQAAPIPERNVYLSIVMVILIFGIVQGVSFI